MKTMGNDMRSVVTTIGIPRAETRIAVATIGIPRAETRIVVATIGIPCAETPFVVATIGIPRAETPFVVATIGLRRGRNNVRMMFEVKEVKEVIATLEVLALQATRGRAIDITSAGETNGRTFVVNSVNFDNFDNFPLSFS